MFPVVGINSFLNFRDKGYLISVLLCDEYEEKAMKDLNYLMWELAVGAEDSVPWVCICASTEDGYSLSEPHSRSKAPAKSLFNFTLLQDVASSYGVPRNDRPCIVFDDQNPLTEKPYMSLDNFDRGVVEAHFEAHKESTVNASLDDEGRLNLVKWRETFVKMLFDLPGSVGIKRCPNMFSIATRDSLKPEQR